MIQELGTDPQAAELIAVALFVGLGIGFVLGAVSVLVIDRFCFLGRDGSIRRFIPKRKGAQGRR